MDDLALMCRALARQDSHVRHYYDTSEDIIRVESEIRTPRGPIKISLRRGQDAVHCRVSTVDDTVESNGWQAQYALGHCTYRMMQIDPHAARVLDRIHLDFGALELAATEGEQ